MTAPGVKINDYKKDTAYADSAVVRAKTEQFIKNKLGKFWHIKEVRPVYADSLQIVGVDKVVTTLDRERPILIEEKIRRAYRSDILIELIADNRFYLKAPRGLGWGLKEYKTDLLMYFYEDRNTGFIYSWDKFQRTLRKNLPYWFDMAKKKQHGFGLFRAYNKNYFSLNIAVPTNIFNKEYVKSGGLII